MGEIFDNIDFTEIFDNVIEVYDSVKPRFVKRVYRIKGKKRYKTIFIYNPLYDLLPSPKFFTMCFRNLRRQ